MTQEPTRVLMVEDQVGDLFWVIDLLQGRGYHVEAAKNEEAAREALAEVAAHLGEFALVILDVMMATVDINRLVQEGNLSSEALLPSLEAGLRLARYLRHDLGVGPRDVRVVCCTARAGDPEVQRVMEQLQIPVFGKVARPAESSLRAWLMANLPTRRPASG